MLLVGAGRGDEIEGELAGVDPILDLLHGDHAPIATITRIEHALERADIPHFLYERVAERRLIPAVRSKSPPRSSLRVFAEADLVFVTDVGSCRCERHSPTVGYQAVRRPCAASRARNHGF